MEDKEDNTGGSPMTEELIADFRDAFKTFDTDEDGYLSLRIRRLINKFRSSCNKRRTY